MLASLLDNLLQEIYPTLDYFVAVVNKHAKNQDYAIKKLYSILLSRNGVNESLKSQSIASCSALSMPRLRYLTANCCCLLKVNAVDEEVASKATAKMGSEINERELRRIRMQIFWSSIWAVFRYKLDVQIEINSEQTKVIF